MSCPTLELLARRRQALSDSEYCRFLAISPFTPVFLFKLESHVPDTVKSSVQALGRTNFKQDNDIFLVPKRPRKNWLSAT